MGIENFFLILIVVLVAIGVFYFRKRRRAIFEERRSTQEAARKKNEARKKLIEEKISNLVELGVLNAQGKLLRYPDQLNLPFRNNEPPILDSEFEPEDMEVERIIGLINNFSALPKSLKAELQVQIYEMCNQCLEYMLGEYGTKQDHLNYEGNRPELFTNPTVPTSEAEVWPLVNFDTIIIKNNHVIIHGNCAWDQEHGIAILLKNGNELVRVGDAVDILNSSLD